MEFPKGRRFRIGRRLFVIVELVVTEAKRRRRENDVVADEPKGERPDDRVDDFHAKKKTSIDGTETAAAVFEHNEAGFHEEDEKGGD